MNSIDLYHDYHHSAFLKGNTPGRPPFLPELIFAFFAISFFRSEESDRIKRCTSKTEMLRTVPHRSNTRDFHTKTDSNGKKVKWGVYSCTCSLLTPRMDLCSALKRERPEKYCCLSDIHQSTDTLVGRCSQFLGQRQPINESSGKQIIRWFSCLMTHWLVVSDQESQSSELTACLLTGVKTFTTPDFHREFLVVWQNPSL